MFELDKMFDFNCDGHLDSFERAAQFQFMDGMRKQIHLMRMERKMSSQMRDLIMMS